MKFKDGLPKNIVQESIELDGHELIGRIYDLSVVSMYFESYEELSKFPDCKYVIDVNESLTMLVERVRSINLSGDMLWLNPKTDQFFDLPIAEYDWLMVIKDVFLMRYISVFDCALILANDVFELNQPPNKCIKSRLIKLGLPEKALEFLDRIERNQEILRNERNVRFHHGCEKHMSSDDGTFRMASLFAKRGSGIQGQDRNGNDIDLMRFYHEAAEEMRKDFNLSLTKLQQDLNDFLDHLREEFEVRFKPKFRDSDFLAGG